MPTSKFKYWRVLGVLAFVGAQLFSHAHLANANPFSGLFDTKDTKESSQDFKNVNAVEMQADKVGFSAATNEATADGNVVVTGGQDKLYSDHLQMNRESQDVTAQGHVYLDSPQQQVDADGLKYNFTKQTGTFTNARVYKDPLQIKGPVIEKISDDHIAMDNGYMTTCDHDIPHYRMEAKRIDVYEGDKAVARGVKMYLGKIPIMYLPSYTQNLKDKPWFTFTPGHKKDLGYFLLTRSQLVSNDHLSSSLRIDGYERQGFGFGLENKYHTDHFGSGSLKTYYIDEHEIAASHPWDPKTSPTVSNKRYKVEWRHKWDIDNQTNAIWQYYRLSDNTILQKYFEKEFLKDPDVTTYFLLTRALPHGNISFRMDDRVNRFVSGIDRLPEIHYENDGEELGKSGFFFKSSDTYSNLVSLQPSPTSVRLKTERLDSNNQLYYPTKIAFIEARPFVGGEHTYYTRTIDPNHDNSIRSVFNTGMDLSTSFYKVYDYHTDFMGIKIDRIRHVITPTASYLYQHRPSLAPSELNQFDTIDAVDRAHKVSLGLENRFQTKRGKESVDLVRTLVTTDYNLKENPGTGSFGPVTSEVEFRPANWLNFTADEIYDHHAGHWESANFDASINGGDKWSFGVGRRYSFEEDDQITTEWDYKINPKWRFKIYDRFYINTGKLQEQDYELTRDLHEWEMGMTLHQLHGNGSEILVVFRLKAFPGMDLNLFSTGYNKPKAGSQSTVAQ